MKFLSAIILAATAAASVDIAEIPDIAEFASLFDAVNAAETIDSIAAFDSINAMDAPAPVCEDIKKRELCPIPKCNYCAITHPKFLADMEAPGCKDANHAKKLQATGRYFCNVDPIAPFCNGRKESDCNTRPECNWCSHPAVGSGCFSVKQSAFIPHKQICAKGSKANIVAEEE